MNDDIPGFKAAQRAYDNQLPPGWDDEPIEDTDAYKDLEERILQERIMDWDGYFTESFTESSDAWLQELAGLVLAGEALKIGDMIIERVHQYCKPDRDDVLAEMPEPGEDDRV